MANNHPVAEVAADCGAGICELDARGRLFRRERAAAPNRCGLAQATLVIETSTSRGPSYQGMPFRSGAFDDCSGKPPAICMSAMSRTPTHPPPIKAATTHQNETIWYPRFPWSRKLPGTDAALAAPLEKSGIRRTVFKLLQRTARQTAKIAPPLLISSPPSTRRVRPRLEPNGLRLLNKARY